ncbi:unnamed protein product [Cylindrotheca closterium]|uniref:Uncharacterized protein n=1 Tax=Cylindrotheca closterium TaxID=2856 RepID=A0AAD2G4A0_9STRA|nr:unnamed protein product [Cylindrotheca closterium]
MEDGEEEYLYIPTTTQMKIISLLVIPSSILSFIGSSLIIYNVSHDRKKSPYRRLLLALSVCDIIATSAFVTSPFLTTAGLKHTFVWSFGNPTSCAVQGAITQFSVAAQLYSCCLSFYFLLTIRYGMRETTFEKRLEKIMHFVVITFALGAATTGLVTGMFYPSHVGPGCWWSHPPEGDICANDSCGAEKMAWIFAGFPTLLCIFAIAINNLLLYCHVRSTVLQGQQRAIEIERKLSTYNKNQRAGSDDDNNSIKMSSGKFSNWDSETKRGSSMLGSGRWGSSEKPRSVLRSSDKQWQRVKDVGKQSFLYVGAYFLCFSATIVKQGLDGQGLDKVEGSGSVFLPLLILQSIFLPAQGLLNFMIHFRPKYIQARRKYTHETRLWCLKRTVFPNKMKPTTRPSGVSLTPSQRGNEDKKINYAGELVSGQDSVHGNSFSRINFNIDSIAGSVHESDQESANANSSKKKRSGTAKRVSYDDEESWRFRSYNRSPSVDSIPEALLEISTREEPTNTPVCDDTTDSQSMESLEAPATGSKRVSHTGEVEDVESNK